MRVDEDYYGIFIETPETVIVEALFSHEQGDIDISLLNNLGRVVGAGYSSTDNERIEACLEAGFYYVHAWSINRRINNSYALTVSTNNQPCCSDDAQEDDDGPAQAQQGAIGGEFGNRAICPGDEDWFSIDLNAGDTLVVDLLFDQLAPESDLDLYLYAPDGQTNLTPCCDVENGQSTTDDERLTYQVNETGRFYVVVSGYRNSANTYLIGFDIEQPGTP